MSAAGYSGTPLAKKLGIRSGCRVAHIGAPSDFRNALHPVPDNVEFDGRATARTDIVHVFVTEREVLAAHLGVFRVTLKPDAVIWVSWPKQASRVKTTVTEDVIRELALPLGYVDVKVCAVNEIWSGLKLVVRKARR